MCGIFGIISDVKDTLNETVLGSCLNNLAHRGPDSSGIFIQKNIGLGHRRLAVYDLSEKGNQPMTRFGHTIVFNGAIYNFIEIRKELELKGYTFISDSDTEVILAAFDHYGKECVNHFNGQWAFGIYTPENNEVFLSRDRFGIKPLYYFSNEDGFYFSSEIKSFIHLPKWKPEINKTRAWEFLSFQMHDHTEETFFKDINQLKKGHNLHYNLSDHTYHKIQYYSISDIVTKPIASANAKIKLNELLNSSIKLRLRSDVKLGFSLSGGLDSSNIIARASKMDSPSLNSFSIVYDDPGISELKYLNALSNELMSGNKKYSPGFKEMFALVDQVLWHQEEPFNGMSILSQFVLMSHIKENNVKVLLDGQGADEILGGYEKFYLIWLKSLIKQNPIKGLYKLTNLNKSFPTFNLIRRYKSYLNSHKNKAPKWLILKPDKAQVFKRSTEKSMLEVSKNLINTLGLSALLRYEDKNAMAHGIESRLPFLDHRLVEFCLSLPEEYKVTEDKTKILLRNCSKDILPAEIVERKDKLGFVTPENKWIRENRALFIQEIFKMKESLQDIVDLTIIDRKASDNELWKVFIFGKWIEKFILKR